nr:hypothetical protein [Delftia acidovorans]
MKERPILFSAPMVRALLAGTKTQTRRIIKDQSIGERFSHMTDDGLAHLEWLGTPCCGSGVWDVPEYSANVAAPYGQPGGRLWVRETWSPCGPEPSDGSLYRADFPEGPLSIKFKPSIHMPRWACRILLEITGVRVERLQDINEQDAAAEGVATWAPGALSPDSLNADPSDQFRWLWSSINGPDSWSANPWVWVVEFKRVQQASSGRPSQLEDAPCNE